MATLSPPRKASHLFVVIWACVIFLPFIEQPLHLDDYFYLDVAENVFRNPLFPQDMPYVFEGERYGDMASHSHPPFVPYYMALAMALLPDALSEEARLHLAFIVFPIIIGIAALELARLFSPHPTMAAMLMLSTPVLMVNSHTLMADVPTLAFWLSALTSFHKLTTEGRARHLILCVLGSVLAAFASYQALSLVLLFALYSWLHGRFDRKAIAACLMPVLFVIGWFAYGYAHYGRFLLTWTVQFAAGRELFDPRQLVERFVAVLCYIGGTTLFPLAYLMMYGGWAKGSVLALLALSSSALIQVFAKDYSLQEKALLALFLAAGAIVTLRIFISGFTSLRLGKLGVDDAGGFFIAVWFGIVFLYCVFLFFTSAARYILPLVPPLVMFVLRDVKLQAGPRAPLRLGALLAATAALGAVLSFADFQFARIYPEMAAHIKRNYDPDASRIWYGGEWGFRHYMKRAGFKLIASDDDSQRGGDLIVLPSLASPYRLAQDVESMLVSVEERKYAPRLPIRLLDMASHAGFHSAYWGLLPFSFSRAPLERLRVYQVSLLCEKLPEAVASSSGPIAPYPAFVEEEGRRSLALIGGVPMRIAYELALPQSSKIEFGVSVLGEDLRTQLPDAVEFSVRVQEEAGPPDEVFRKLIAGKSSAGRYGVDLTAFGGKMVKLILEASSGNDVSKGRRAAWIDFKLIPQRSKP